MDMAIQRFDAASDIPSTSRNVIGLKQDFGGFDPTHWGRNQRSGWR
jgi:hypothetical protein